jgi:hypothetical protein
MDTTGVNLWAFNIQYVSPSANLRSRLVRLLVYSLSTIS